MIDNILNSQHLTCEVQHSLQDLRKSVIRWAVPYVNDIMSVAPSLSERWDEVDTTSIYNDPLKGYNDPSGGTAEYHGMEIHSRTLAVRNVITHLLGVQVTL
jgi:hypothetical protein